jgi:outer membrane protein insertion porin family
LEAIVSIETRGCRKKKKWAALVWVRIVFVFFLFSLMSQPSALCDPLSEMPDSKQWEWQVDGKMLPFPAEIWKKLTPGLPSQWPNEIIKELARSGFYTQIAVEEGPVGRSPRYRVSASLQKSVGEISFSGLGLTEENLYKRLLKSKVGGTYVPQDLEIDRERIRTRLLQRGYPNAQVPIPTVEPLAEGQVRILFSVNRGRPCRVAEVVTLPDAGVFDFITLPVESGALCDTAAIEDSLERERNRLRTEGFLDANLKLESLSYTVDKERAVVRLYLDRGSRTRIEVINSATGALAEDLISSRGGLSAVELVYLSEDELRNEIQRGFQSRGYSSASVTGPNKYTAQNGDVIFRYFVQPGQQLFIGRIEFRGMLPISRSGVIEKIGLAPGFFSSRIPYVERELSQYREKLLAIYYDEGYADAKIEGPTVEFSADGRTANLLFRLEPGLRYLVRDFTVFGKPKEFQSDEEVFYRVLGPGEPVSKQRLRLLEEETRLELLKLGFAYAKVSTEPNVVAQEPNGKPVQILLTIDAGPLVRVGRVFAEGELYGKGDRVIRESGLEPGDLFTPDALDAARLRILRHDLYGNVQIEALNAQALEEKREIVDVVIRTQGRGGYSLGLGPGYGTRNGYRFSVDFAVNNLTKDGLRLNSNASLSQEKQQRAFNETKQLLGRKITVGLVEPLFRVGNWVSPFDVSVVSGLEVASQALSNRFFETFDLGVSYKAYFWDVSWNFYSKFAHEWSKVIGSGLEPIEALDRPTLRIHEVIFGVGIDTRNNVEWPTRGRILDISSSHARFGLYSEVEYDRISADISQYFPVYERWSGALGGGIARITNIRNERSETVTAPGSRRSSLTGRSMVRGFPDGGAGLGPLIWLDLQAPRSSPGLPCSPILRPIGATNVIYLKSELRYRSPWFSEMLGFAWFVDSGATYFTESEQNALSARLEEFNRSVRTNQAGAADSSSNSCEIRAARLIGNDAIAIKDTSAIEQYFRRSYISSGIGARVIIPDLASINVDWGLPLYDPADGTGGCQTVKEATSASSQPPTCVKRKGDDKIFGSLRFPGAFFVGIGANF